MSEIGGQEGGTWRMWRIPDRRHGGKVIPDVMNDVFFTLRKISGKFCVDICIRSVSRMWGQEWRYLKNIEGS